LILDFSLGVAEIGTEGLKSFSNVPFRHFFMEKNVLFIEILMMNSIFYEIIKY